MYNMLLKETVMGLASNTPVEGLLYIRPYVEKPTSSGSSTYIAGTAFGKGSIPFKVWQGETFNKMKAEDLSGKICFVKAEVNEFGNAKSLIIKDITSDIGEDCNLGPYDFMESKYNPEELWTCFWGILKQNTSPEAFAIVEKVIAPVKYNFEMEFAAVNHHDNCMHGLLAHTSKVVKIAQIVKFYPVIRNTVTMDAIMVGCALHDIGKVLEYNNGNISEEGKILNHLTLGLRLIMEHRYDIVNSMGQNFYDTLLSVIQQHHGQYGERPKTLAAYLVHTFDMLDAKLTDVSELIENSCSDTIKVDDFYLRFNKKQEG